MSVMGKSVNYGRSLDKAKTVVFCACFYFFFTEIIFRCLSVDILETFTDDVVRSPIESVLCSSS